MAIPRYTPGNTIVVSVDLQLLVWLAFRTMCGVVDACRVEAIVIGGELRGSAEVLELSAEIDRHRSAFATP